MTKVLSNKVKTSAYTQAFLLSSSGAFFAIVVSPLLGGISFDISKTTIYLIFIVGLVTITQGLGNIFYFASIRFLTNGTAQIAFSSIIIFNSILSTIFLGLRLNFINIFGVILLILSILLVITDKLELNWKGVSLMIIAAALFSVFQLSSAELSKQVSAATYLLIAYLGSAFVVGMIKFRPIMKDILNSTKTKLRFEIPFLTAIPSLGNFLFAYYAYRSSPEPAKVAMLLTSQVVLTVILSYFFLREKGHLIRKIVAATVVVIATILIKN